MRRSGWILFGASCRAANRCRINVGVDCELVRALVLITIGDLTVEKLLSVLVIYPKSNKLVHFKSNCLLLEATSSPSILDRLI